MKLTKKEKKRLRKLLRYDPRLTGSTVIVTPRFDPRNNPRYGIGNS